MYVVGGISGFPPTLIFTSLAGMYWTLCAYVCVCTGLCVLMFAFQFSRPVVRLGICRGCTSLDVVWSYFYFCLQGILLECGFVEVVLHQPLYCFDCISVFKSCGHTASSYVVMFVFLFTRPAARVWILDKLCCSSTCLVMFVFQFTILCVFQFTVLFVSVYFSVCVSVHCSVCVSVYCSVCFSVYCFVRVSLFCGC